MAHRILHLSDTHVTASGFDEDGVDALAALDRLLNDLRHLTGLSLVVVTGDIADDGSVEGCAIVRERVGRFAAARGIPHVYTTGNHDRRPGFRAALGSGHLDASGADVGRVLDGLDDERAAVSTVGGLRIVTLDSLVPGSVHGVLGARQLTALRELLRDRAPSGTVLALHHPPIHTTTAPWTREAGLQDRQELAAAIEGTDVVAVLCGHFHAQLAGHLGAAAVWATPGVVTRMDLTAPPHVTRGVLGAGATVVDLGGEFSPTFHVLHARDPRAGVQVYAIEAANVPDAINRDWLHARAMTNADEPRIDNHPDQGQEEFERSGAEDEQLERVGEASDSSDDTKEASSPEADQAGPDAPAPLTTPAEERR